MSMTPFEAVVRLAQVEALENRATVAGRATLFKSGPNYLCVGESGFLVHICHREYDNNGHFIGYAAMNYQWQWSEVRRLAFDYQTRGLSARTFTADIRSFSPGRRRGTFRRATITRPRKGLILALRSGGMAGLSGRRPG